MLIDAIATRPAVTCPVDTTIATVAKLLATTGVGCVVVVDEHERPAGVCTDRDLVVRALAGSWPLQTPVHCAMSEPAITLPVGTDVTTAIEAMHRHGIRRLPLVTADGRIDGVVSLDDVNAMLAAELDQTARVAQPVRRR